MIVAGADVAVGGEIGAFPAHDQAQLGVRLELDEPVHHVHARAFQVARPADVGGLVEAGLELDHGGHRLAEIGRVLQGAHDRAVVGGAVERPFDGHDVGVGHGLAQQLHDHVEELVGVMHHDVLLADGREAIAVELADALGKADVEGLEDEIGALRHDQPGRVGEPEHALLDEHGVVADLGLLHHEALQAGGHLAVDLEPDDVAAAPALERGLVQRDEILRLLLHLDVTVAQDPEGAVAARKEAWKQARQEHADHRTRCG